jgi:predicted ribonuclease YlaK
MTDEKCPYLPHEALVKDLHSVVRDGLDARVQHPKGETARQVCRHLWEMASENATNEEKRYLPLVKQRIDRGNLSDKISEEVAKKVQKTDLTEAIFNVYSALADCLEENKMYA